ncbi:MAG: hydrolase [Gemmatimonadetes bacterium]|nr:hydrolase [Gemmatimonadota bacterium]
MEHFANRLDLDVRHAAILLEELPDDARVRTAPPGRWSAIEILGHLIDSASNNHQRFVRARWQPDLVFGGYQQDEWVAAQRYAESPWRETVELWRSFNLHIAHVMRTTPDDVLRAPRAKHNLDRVAWKPVPAGEPTTLEYFMRDYIEHLEHHMVQVEALTGLALLPRAVRA